MPDQRLDFAVATRVLSPRAFLTSSAEPEAALATVGTQELPDGAVVFVRSVRSWFRLNRAAGGAPDGITIVDAQGPGQWERFDLPDSSWLTQAQWHINATTGSDENDGSAASPLASWAELARRWGNYGELQQDTTVFIETNLAEPLVGIFRGKENIVLRIKGQITATLAIGTLTAVTPVDGATQQPTVITDSNIGDWDTAGPGGTSLIGERIRLTSGANVGAAAWLAKRDAATVARTSPFATNDTSVAAPAAALTVQVDPAVNDDFSVESLTTVEAISIGIDRPRSADTSNPTGMVIEDVDVVSVPGARCDNLGTAAILFVRSRLDVIQVANGPMAMTISALDTPIIAKNVPLTLGAMLMKAASGVTNVSGAASLVIAKDTLFQGQRLHINAGTNLNASGSGIFDSPGDALVLFAGGTARAGGLLYGTGNAGVGIEVEGATAFTYVTKPIVTGAGGDTSVGDDGVIAYAAIPLFNISDGSAIVEV